MAKKKTIKKKRDRVVKYKITAYQIQIKGPVRNETMQEMLNGMRNRLINGLPFAEQDKYGNVIRALSGKEDTSNDCLILRLVKYNSIDTGLSWDIAKDKLLDNNNQVTAQRTDLIIFKEKHIAYHVHKPHGPSTTQIESYLKAIFEKEKINQKIECTIDIIPLKIEEKIKKVHQWKIIKKFQIQVYRLNPDGSIDSKLLKDFLKKSKSDKLNLELSSQEVSGIKKSSINELIDAGDKIVTDGIGRITIEGINENNKKDQIDSDKSKTKVNIVPSTESDKRSIVEIILGFFY